VAGHIGDHYCLRFDRGVVHIVEAGHIVDHYCLRFGREKCLILLWLVILLTITV
jgi:hypothetical protein